MSRQQQPQSQNVLHSLPYLFDRPTEPLFIAKDNVAFDVPVDYYNDKYKPLASSIQTRFPPTGNVVPVQNVQIPDISVPEAFDRRAKFTVFNPYHRACAVRLIEVLMGMPNLESFLSACVYCRERVNPYMFVYAASIAILHRRDTRGVPVPSHVETFPEFYVDGAVFNQAREEATVVPAGSRTPIEIPRDYTASDLDEEHRVAYWREDIGINLHHWHWHLIYPVDGPREIVAKDRRGEMFYYMHEQIMGRYNIERLCNGLARTKRFTYWREPIPEGYFPKLDSLVASRVWPARQPNSILSDIDREADQVSFDVADLERWSNRIFEAIHNGSVNDGQRDIPLTEPNGIDLLGNIIEASILSINRNRYGDFHLTGHIMLGYIHDPDNRYLESFGTIGDPTTSMRDPIFYRWHAYVDDMFQEYKSTLPPYTAQQLGFDGVRVTAVEVVADGLPSNEFQTFWQQSDVDLSRGLDFAPRGNVFARFTHLQHAPFTYRIRVENSGAQRSGTVRIFLAPRFDERGTPFLLREQRLMFIELDKFTVTLTAGNNSIERRSTQASTTIPFEQTFRSLANRPTDVGAQDSFNYCGCGWPQHMLIPKGTAEGYTCDLFVMVSNGQDDLVADAVTPQGPGCDDAQSFCGLRNSRYPDRRAMGFPFDKPAAVGVNTMRQFMTPNMFLLDTRIRYSNRVVANPRTQLTQPTSGGSGGTRTGGSGTGGTRTGGSGTGSRPSGGRT